MDGSRPRSGLVDSDVFVDSLTIDYDTAARCSLLILGPGYPAQDEFLGQVGGRSLSSVNKEITQEQPHAAIRCRVVGIREGGRGQISAYRRVVCLPPSVVSFADEWTGQCVENARLICARALVEVARILVQERRQDGATDHDVAKAIRIDGAIALSVTDHSLAVVGRVSCLIGSRKH